MKNEMDIKQETLLGQIAVDLANNQTLDDFCTEYINDYNRDRFEALAIRVFVGNETVITVYAVDKNRQENTSINIDKLPVKKFKITTLTLPDILSYCKGFNFTLSTGNYALDDMEVINK